MRGTEKNNARYSVDNQPVTKKLLVSNAQGLFDYDAAQAVTHYQYWLAGGLE